MSKSAQPRALLHTVLTEIEAVGIVEFEHTGSAVLAYDRRGLHTKACKALEPYTRYMCACLARRAGERLTFVEARKLLGFVGCPHIPGPTLLQRDALMEAAGWPTETLTLEELVFPTPPLRAGQGNIKEELRYAPTRHT